MRFIKHARQSYDLVVYLDGREKRIPICYRSGWWLYKLGANLGWNDAPTRKEAATRAIADARRIFGDRITT